MKELKNVKVLFIIGLLFASTSLSAQVSADFNISKTEGCSPFQVEFTDNSAGNIISYFWDLGSGKTSTIQNPKAIYYNPGKYTVKLFVKGSGSDEDSLIRTEVITVFQGPTAKAVEGQNVVCANDSVSFTDLSEAGDGAINYWRWDMGDGKLFSTPNAKHAYSLGGKKYTVSLIVKDVNGCESSISLFEVIDVKKLPEVIITADKTEGCSLPHKVAFSSSTNGKDYFWDFGDGSGDSTTSSPSHDFNSFSSFTTSLTVIDTLGCVNSNTVNIDVNEITPNFISVDTVSCEANEVKFVNTTSPLLNGATYSWDFGDGSTSDLTSPKHTYTKFGKYNVTLTVNYGDCEAIVVKNEFVEVVVNPEVTYTRVDSFSCESPKRVTFTNTTPNTYIQTWDFGDGTRGSKTIEKHDYTVEKTYNIRLFVLDRNGCMNSIIVPETIEIPSLVADFTPDTALKGCVPYDLTVEDNSQSSFPIVSTEWNFGDGSTGSNTVENHLYNNVGTYSLEYIVTNSKGCSDTLIKEVKVGEKTIPNFISDKRVVCNNEPVTFTCTTPDGNPKIDTYSWSIGGNTRVNIQEFRLRPDTLPVTLILESNGCKSDTTFEDYLIILGPYADIATNYDKCGSDTFHFVNQSLEYDNFFWKHDSTTSTTDTIKYFENNFNVQKEVEIVVSNSVTGCMDSTTAIIEKNIKPVLDIVENTIDCTPSVLTYTNNSSRFDSLKWFIEGELVSEDFNPSIDLTTPGNYIVEIQGFGQNGCEYTYYDTVVAPGIELKASVTQDGLCVPLNVELYDSMYDVNNPKVWVMSNGDSVVQTSQLEVYTFTEIAPDSSNNIYTVTLKSDYTGGCNGSAEYEVTTANPIATIGFTGVPKCNRMETTVSAAFVTATGPVYYDWEIEGDSFSGRSIVYDYTTPRTNVVANLTITDGNGCKADFNDTIRFDQDFLAAKFEADTSGSFCPPLSVNFTDLTTSPGVTIKSWLWEFGDGTSSILQNPSKLYLTPGSFNVKLTVVDVNDCVATVEYPDFIGIKGPTGTFSFDLSEACSPADIKFTANTLNAQTIQWDMGDGIVRDGSEINHIYPRPGKYIPLLILGDSLGCTFVLPPIDTIEVFPKPESNFSFDGLCMGGETSFRNGSTVSTGSITSSSWSFSDGGSSTTTNPSHSFPTTERLHTAVLVTETDKGCKDTLEREITLYGVNASFDISEDTLCMGETLVVNNSTSSDTTIDQFSWVLGSIGTSTEQDPAAIVTEKGWHTIKIVATDVLGCIDSLEINNMLLVGDTAAATISDLLRVSVVDNNTIDMKYKSNADADFFRYELFRENGVGDYTKIYESKNSLDTLYVDRSVNTLSNSHCYKVSTENICNGKASLDALKRHCTVNVEASPRVNSVSVDWNHYEGWDEVETYSIYKENNLGEYKYLTTVPGTDSTYVDSNIYCENEMFYKVLANQFEGTGENSWSDTSGSKPILINIVPPNEMWRVSVENDEHVLLEWLPVQEPRFEITKYILDRSEDGEMFSLWQEFPNSDTTVVDNQSVDVDRSNYHYRMRAVDVCGDTSSFSNYSKTILLTVEMSDNHRPSLSWNHYEGWNEGVEEYIVEFQDEDGEFYEIGKVAGNETTFVDEITQENCTPNYRYRITAVRSSSNWDRAISHSNVAQAPIESHLYAPNAFTLNDDNLNEDFRVKGMYISNYNIKIYNRWGEKLYDQTSCLDEHWDGTYNGERVQAGVYVFVIDALGADGHAYHQKGTITLIR
jgi:gliding motility-associated-like protein